MKAKFGDENPTWKKDTLWSENFNLTIEQNQSKFKVMYVGFVIKNMSTCICYIISKMYIYSDVKVCRHDCRYVKVRFKIPWMSNFSDLHFMFWLFNLAFCIIYKLKMNSEFENVRKKVLIWQSFLKSWIITRPENNVKTICRYVHFQISRLRIELRQT